MKILSIDYGDKRIGIASGDTNIGIAFAKDNIIYNNDTFSNILKICHDNDIQKIIIGLPVMLEGETSDSSHKAMEFKTKLYNYLQKQKEEQLSESIEFIDERLSTNIAQYRLNVGQCKTHKKRSKIDSASAQVLLENYFSRLKNS